MSNFFTKLNENNLYHELAETLDWLFDENKFSDEKGWDKNKSGSYTRKIKRMEYISSKENYICGKKEDIIYCLPKNKNRNKNKNNKDIYIIFSSDSSESRNLIRHIRNGIAHGNAIIYNNDTKKYSNAGKQYIEIEDFGKKDKETGETKSAYINIPLEYIIRLHKLYNDTKKEASNSSKAKSSKKRSTAKKKQKQTTKVGSA